MARRYEQAYQVKRNDNLGDPEFWNRRFEDVDLRLAAAEQYGDQIEGAVDQLTSVALSRLNDTFTPVLNEAIDRLASVGALFSSTSPSTNTIGAGNKTFLLDADTRTGFVVPEYVAIRPADYVDRGLVAQVTGYDRITGLLDVAVVLFVGSGSYGDWVVRISGAPDLEHSTRTDNPHATTAAQVGAYTAGQVDSIVGTLNSAIALLAPQVSPALSGTPTAPTPPLGANSTRIATMAALKAMRDDLVGGAGTSLDQLNELAAALNNDANFGSGVLAALANRLRVDAGSAYSDGQKTQGRKNIYAAPFDALAFNGMQVNGSHQVSQFNGDAEVILGPGVSGYVTDNWLIKKSGIYAMKAKRIASGVNGIEKSLQATVTTAQSSLGGDIGIFATFIEGDRLKGACWGTAAAMPISFATIVRVPKIGNYRVLGYNYNSTAAADIYVNVPIANTPCFVTGTFPAQTTGTWKTDNAIGMEFQFYFAGGGGPNTVDTAGAVVSITGLITLPGIELPIAEALPRLIRPQPMTLRECEYLWEQDDGTLCGSAGYEGSVTSGQIVNAFVRYRVPKRIQPNLIVTNIAASAFNPAIDYAETSTIGLRSRHIANATGNAFFYDRFTANSRF